MARARKPNRKPKTPRRGRGGLRFPAGGRPAEPKGAFGINWARVRRWARLGGDRQDILDAIGVDKDVARDPDFISQLEAELKRGYAEYRLNLRIEAAALRRGSAKGSVNALLASLRNTDRPMGQDGKGAQRPDPAGAVAEIQRVLKRVAS